MNFNFSFDFNFLDYLLISDSVATLEPKAILEVSTAEGGWTTGDFIDFGPQLAGVSLVRQIRIRNAGGSALTITKSKVCFACLSRLCAVFTDLCV